MIGKSPVGIADHVFHRAIAEGADLHAVTGLDGSYRFVSRTGLERFGWRPDELIGQREHKFVHPDDIGLVRIAHRQAQRGATAPTLYRFLCADGTYCWIESVSTVVWEHGEQFIVSTIRDVGDRKETELDLQRLATTDSLTGLANRTVLMDRLQHALRRLERHDGILAVLFLDLDHFKLVNDTMGHHVGDSVLAQMAERLRGFLRPEDTLARLGGDEFAIVIEDIKRMEEAVGLGQRIVAAGRAPFVIGEESFVCTTSVGISATTDARHSADGLLQEADLALYRAKHGGRERAEVFDDALRCHAVGRVGVERMLRRAIDEDRLRIAYQPIIDLRTGATVASEALVRVWDADEHELIVAATFIDVAEESGLVRTIDDWMLDEVSDQIARWYERLVDTSFADVAINIGARHLSDPRFAPTVIEHLENLDLPTSCLQLEVTERVLMGASNSAMAGLARLHAAGVKVGLDNFGTGYSSVSYLRQVPLDFVTIDRSCIREIIDSVHGRGFVGSVIDLSHALGIAVVAKGVETQAQAEALRDLGCDRAQGFWFAPAGTADALEDRILGSSPATRLG